MSDFILFKKAVAKQFASMQDQQLFRTSIEKDAMWNTYIGAFPEGSNPMFRERTEHDCTACKQFIRSIGDVVAIKNGKLVSVWDLEVAHPAYQTVADALAKAVKAKPIEDFYLHDSKTVGVDKNFEARATGSAFSWEHFHVTLPQRFVMAGYKIATQLGGQRTLREVFHRGLETIDLETLNTVLELIDQNSIYRGQEKRGLIVDFIKVKKQYDLLKTAKAKELYTWSTVTSVNPNVAGIRNDVIGTLLLDIAVEGLDIEAAVVKFGKKMDPTNYRRPSTIVTKSMIQDAQKKIEEMGLTSALDRRYAHLEDIKVGNILFADRAAKKKLGGSVFDDLADKAGSKAPKSMDKVEEITIDKFIQDVLPKADSVEVMFDPRHQGNLFSLVAPADPTAGQLFKWDNGFSWAYNGDLTDSIKERVKQAGGNVTGDLCCRLAWYNHDDLDFHMKEPNGNHIYYGNKISKVGGGQLDVDMNAGIGTTRTPVENIFYPNRNKMQEGVYQLIVNQFRLREHSNVGFDVEIDFMGDVMQFSHPQMVRDGALVSVAKFKYSHAKGIEYIESLSGKAGAGEKPSKDVWGIGTNRFHKAKLMMLSPNHWDGQRGNGNKHFFFVLDGCKNEGEARGFFNEFLNPELDKHRKVFEVVGGKMKAKEGAENQLSGLGFSSTQKDQLVVKVTGAFSRMLKINF